MEKLACRSSLQGEALFEHRQTIFVPRESSPETEELLIWISFAAKLRGNVVGTTPKVIRCLRSQEPAPFVFRCSARIFAGSGACR
jgi:hypothetical protein